MSIIDNGQGVSQEYIPNLFKHYYRIETSKRSQVNGVWLGDIQLITIAVDSKINQRTTFSFQFNSIPDFLSRF